jgi:hypothetical protein
VAVTVANLTEGPGTLYTAPFGTTEPLDTALASAPAAPWVDCGGTQGGVKLKVAQTYKELEVDQVVDIPGRRLTKREITIDTNLAEPTMANLKLSLNDGTVTTGTGTAGFEPAYATSAVSPTYTALLLDGYAPGGPQWRRRVVLRKVLSVEDVESAYQKDDQTFIPVTFSAHYVSASIAPFRVVDQTA